MSWSLRNTVGSAIVHGIKVLNGLAKHLRAKYFQDNAVGLSSKHHLPQQALFC